MHIARVVIESKLQTLLATPISRLVFFDLACVAIPFARDTCLLQKSMGYNFAKSLPYDHVYIYFLP
jgi:hypothetical protein